MDGLELAETRPGRVELGGGRDHRLVAGRVELALLQCRADDAHAERLAEDQLVARPRAGVAFQVPRIDQADGHQSIYRFDGIDGVAAGDRNAGTRAHRLAAFEDLADHVERNLVHGHADEGQGEERLAAHRIDVGDGVGGGDRAEIERIVDDRHEEIGGRDDRLRVVQAIHRRVIARLDSDEELPGNEPRGRPRENLLQDARGDLAAASAAVAELGEPDLHVHRCSSFHLLSRNSTAPLTPEGPRRGFAPREPRAGE